MSRRRTLITGIGAVSPLGIGIEPTWEALCRGESAIAPIKAFDATGFRSTLAAEVPDYALKEHIPKHYRKAAKVMLRDMEQAVIAAKLGAENAKLMTAGVDPDAQSDYQSERMGCTIGAGLMAAEINDLSRALATARDDAGSFSHELWGEGKMQNLTPLWMLTTLPNMLACHVTILHQCKGPSNTVTCGEASGLISIGEMSRIIERGDADMGLAGSAESKVNPAGLIRLDLAEKLARTQGEEGSGHEHVKPYSETSTGTVLGEGGALLVLESEDTLSERGVKAIAEVAGFGSGLSAPKGDADHRARGIIRAINASLEDAGIGADQVDAILPGALGEADIDAAELVALRSVFGKSLESKPLVMLVPAIGNAIAGYGGLQAGIGVKILQEQLLPPALVRGDLMPADINAAREEATPGKFTNILVLNRGFGGPAAALVLRAI
ncbi:MAG: beta-ketoacyl synthase N-terminal-like domain-containing protein [Planctomycetota bacterium]